MGPLLLAVVLMQSACSSGAQVQVAASLQQVASFDMIGAIRALDGAAAQGCADAQVAALYLKGWVAARAAYAAGGSAASLTPVREAAAALETLAQGRPGPAEIARAVLIAAAAAAQSERGEMQIYLAHALALEQLQLAAGQPGAPGVTAHEAAGDLWLQVHWYDDAREAYRHAEQVLGVTARTTLGLARVAARSNDTEGACASYRRMVAMLPTASRGQELAEADKFLTEHACRAGDLTR